MDPVNSSELDDAIFPQPPQNVSIVGNMFYEGAIVKDPTQLITKFNDEHVIDSLPEILKDKASKEPVSADAGMSRSTSQKSVKKCNSARRKSRIRRILNGIGLMKIRTDSTSEDDSDDSIEDQSVPEKINCEPIESNQEGIENKNGFSARMIQKVHNKANKVWQSIGSKFGGRSEADTVIDESTDESFRDTSLNLSVIKINSKEDSLVQEEPSEINVKIEEDKAQIGMALISQGKAIDEVPTTKDDEPAKLDLPTPGSKSGSLKRLASGLKNGLLLKRSS